MAIVFISAPMYDDVAPGKTNNFFHTFMMWNDNVEVPASRNISDPGVGEASNMFLLPSLSGDLDDNRKWRRSVEAE
jgi:hypothetical protein